MLAFITITTSTGRARVIWPWAVPSVLESAEICRPARIVMNIPARPIWRDTPPSARYGAIQDVLKPRAFRHLASPENSPDDALADLHNWMCRICLTR